METLIHDINTFRALATIDSNNIKDPSKNICVLEVAKHLGVDSMSTYFHSVFDLIEATKTLYKVKTIAHTNSKTRVCDVLPIIQFLSTASITPLLGAIVAIHGHVLFVDKKGEVAVDTNPWRTWFLESIFTKDRRKVSRITLVYNQ